MTNMRDIHLQMASDFAQAEAILRELLAHEDAFEIVTFSDTQKAPRGFAYDTQTAFA